jgi:tetratricopeptide (TPR) repeat protein
MVLMWAGLNFAYGQEGPAWRSALDRAEELRRLNSPAAEEAYVRAEELARRAGDHSAALARVRTALAALYVEQGRYGSAETELRQAVETEREDPATTEKELALTLHTLAIVTRNTGRYQEAEQLELEAIRTTSAGLDDRASHVAYLNSLGSLYVEVGRLAEAEDSFRRAMRIGQQLTGAGRAYLAESLTGLAEIDLLRGDVGRARQFSVQAQVLVESVLGPDDLEVARALNEVARTGFAMRRFQDARRAWLRSLEILERRLPPDHGETLTVLTHLGEVALLERRYPEAEKLVRRAVEGAEHRKDPALLGLALHHLALVYSESKRFADADDLFRRSLALTEETLGPSHPEVGFCLGHHAQLLSRAGKPAESEVEYRRAIAAVEQSSGRNSVWLAQLLKEYGAILRKLGRRTEARGVEERAESLRHSIRTVAGQTVSVTDLGRSRGR